MLAYAVRGRGTYIEKKRIWLSKRTNYQPMVVDESSAREKIKYQKKTDLRSTVDNIFLLLNGQACAYVNITAKIWDLSPASLLFEEAGLTISDASGEPYIWHRNSGLVAAPKTVHEKLIRQMITVEDTESPHY